MAAKYQLITELYRRTGVSVAKSPQAWQSFLSSACRNYKCRFDEQLLIYAQRPDAVAVAELGTWNKLFKRWVNKDSKNNISFIFQAYNLIDYLTPAENVALTSSLPPLPLLERLGLTKEEAKRNVLKLSGGQQQRVAIARALASEAPVILADVN